MQNFNWKNTIDSQSPSLFFIPSISLSAFEVMKIKNDLTFRIVERNVIANIAIVMRDSSRPVCCISGLRSFGVITGWVVVG
jgi:hypothetical protein